METKQVILVRKDLKMPKGKLAAQVAHASLGAVLDQFRRGNVGWQLASDEWTFLAANAHAKPVMEWLNGSFAKICLGVDSLEEMDKLHGLCEGFGIPKCRITDEGRTFFNKPTTTCCAIGPFYSDAIDEITGHLRLL